MSYQYRVRDSMGNTHTGNIEAASVEDATQQLRRDGFQVLELDEAGDDGLFPRRISRSDLIYVTSQLAIMVDTGITLSTALGGIVEQEPNPTLRRVLKDLKEAVDGGTDFSTALAKYPKTSTRPTSPWSRRARPRARWAPCSTASPPTCARNWRPAARSGRPWLIPR